MMYQTNLGAPSLSGWNIFCAAFLISAFSCTVCLSRFIIITFRCKLEPDFASYVHLPLQEIVGWPPINLEDAWLFDYTAHGRLFSLWYSYFVNMIVMRIVAMTIQKEVIWLSHLHNNNISFRWEKVKMTVSVQCFIDQTIVISEITIINYNAFDNK